MGKRGKTQRAQRNAEFRREEKEKKEKEEMNNEISELIIKAGIEVHRHLGGPGLLESIYEDALFHELQLHGLHAQQQVVIPVIYKDIPIRNPMRLDLLVEDRIIVEVKASEENHSIHKTQLLTYLRLTKCKLGLVLNFGQPLLVDGVTRIVNNF